MGKTMSEKILARASGQAEVSAGDIVWVNADKLMLDDILGPRVEIDAHMKALGGSIWDVDKVVVISDHYTPPANIQQAEIVKFTRDWAAAHSVTQYYEYEGPCHQLMAEYGHVQPGAVVLGTDSHTCMGGALGAFATGIGSTEALGVLLTGKTWLKVPESILVQVNGTLPRFVMAKDISLFIIGAVGHAGATYKAVEYCGSTINALPVEERMAITNMAVEMGAKAGLMRADQKVFDYLAQHGGVQPRHPVESDLDAEYCRRLHVDAEDLVPLVACPHEVDNVAPAAELQGTPLHQVYIGSCTGGRLSDLCAAAELLRGKKIAKGLRMLVSPASQTIWKRAAEQGVLGVLAEAGASILAPTCGVCVGLHSGLLAGGENGLSTTNRNFIGRMGSKDARIYLSSAATVAASALTGRITDPRALLEKN